MSHKPILSVISVPKIIKFSGNLTNLWQKQFCTVVFETRCILINGMTLAYVGELISLTCSIRTLYLEPMQKHYYDENTERHLSVSRCSEHQRCKPVMHCTSVLQCELVSG